MPDGILIEDHATTGQSNDIETDRRGAVSLLGRGPRTEFLLRVSGAHHYFCSHDSSVTVRANWIGPDFAFMVFSGAVATIGQKALMYLVVAVTVHEFAADLIVEVNSSLGHLAGIRC